MIKALKCQNKKLALEGRALLVYRPEGGKVMPAGSKIVRRFPCFTGPIKKIGA